MAVSPLYLLQVVPNTVTGHLYILNGEIGQYLLHEGYDRPLFDARWPIGVSFCHGQYKKVQIIKIWVARRAKNLLDRCVGGSSCIPWSSSWLFSMVNILSFRCKACPKPLHLTRASPHSSGRPFTLPGRPGTIPCPSLGSPQTHGVVLQPPGNLQPPNDILYAGHFVDIITRT